MRDAFNDSMLSLLCGLALLGAVRLAYPYASALVPDDQWLAGADPLARLALARLAVFAVLAAVAAFAFAWPLARHASRRDVVVTLPGASCAAVLFVLLEQWQWFDPFPVWFTIARALVLSTALIVATLAWWRSAR